MRDSYKVLIKPSEGTYSELRSKFLAFAIPVRTAEEALEQVAKYQKEYFDARHVCWAYRLGPEGEEYRSNDNGEPSGTAGKPILGQMVSAGATTADSGIAAIEVSDKFSASRTAVSN